MHRRMGTIKAGILAAMIVLGGGAWIGAAETAHADAALGQASRLPRRTWENYFGVAILPSDRAIVVGDKGTILISDDKGHSWTRRQQRKGDALYDLYSVAFAPDGARGWVVGDGGAIFRSDDRGATWTAQDGKVTAALLKVTAVDAQKACAVGEHGTVICTGDGGATWNAQKFEDYVFFDVAFTDPMNGWAVGEFATTLHTGDGGKTWSVQTGAQRAITADPFFAIAFTSPTDGLVTGLNGEDEVTNDGGKSWKAGNLDGESHSIYAVAKSTDGELYLGGADGAMAMAAQGKVLPVASATSNAITGLAMSPHFGLAVGLSGTVLESDDGQHWSSVAEGDAAQARVQ